MLCYNNYMKMSNFTKKLALILLSSIMFLNSMIIPIVAIAQSESPAPEAEPATWYNQGPLDFYTKVMDESNPSEIFGERYTYAQVGWIFWSIIGQIAGITPQRFREIKATLSNPETLNSAETREKIANSWAVKKTSAVTAEIVSSPPASFRYWLSTRLEKYSLVKTAHAQTSATSFGYVSLNSFLTLWTASRNFAFGLMVLIIISIAFGIMFRIKINPQTLVSIQSSIPKVISALILITFSYAIVGLLIDLMYALFGALVYGLDAAGAISGYGLDPNDLFNSFLNSSILDEAAGPIWTSVILFVVGLGLTWTVVMIPLVPFILGLAWAILVFFFKAFMMLAETYISLIINIVFGPIIILSEAIPFVKASAIGWFKSVVADLMIFFAVGVLLLLQVILSSMFDAATTIWSPPYLSINTTMLKIMIWLGIWSMIPNLRPKIYEMFEKRAAAADLPREFSGVGKAFSEGVGTSVQKGKASFGQGDAASLKK